METLGSIGGMTVKFPTPGGKSCPDKSPVQPFLGGAGGMGQHIDRCIIIESGFVVGLY